MSDSNNSSQNERLWELFIFYIVYLFSCWKSNNEETALEAVSPDDIAKAHDFATPPSPYVDSCDTVQSQGIKISVR
jgi:hypothetical protein